MSKGPAWNEILMSADEELAAMCEGRWPVNLPFVSALLPLLPNTTNSIICPHGIMTVLGMVADGANEETQNEILDVLGIDGFLGSGKYKMEMLHLLIGDEEKSRNVFRGGRASSTTPFITENFMVFTCGKERPELRETYCAVLKERYHTSIRMDETDGPSMITLANAAEFKSKWFEMMTKITSGKYAFHNRDESVSYPVFLSTEVIEHSLYYDDKVTSVAISFELVGGIDKYSLVFILSDEPLTKEILRKCFASSRAIDCQVIFPEFSIENEHTLIPMMTSIGLKSVFDEAKCPIDRICTKALFVNDFTQKAKIEVDQEGMVARASTLAQLKSNMMPPNRKIVIDKPFYYFLRNNVNAEVLFMGKVNVLNDYETMHRTKNNLNRISEV